MGETMQFYDEAEIRQQEMQRDGTLLCRDVTVGRTGVQVYHASELMLHGDHFIDVWRDEHEVFDPQSMASFEGKPIVMGHESSEQVGVMGNLRRRGSMLIADLWVRAKHAVDAIRRRGWRGISLGYSADYDPSDGRYRQRNIRGEHCALLDPNSAPRCGAACMIGDSAWRTNMKRTRDDHGDFVSGVVREGEMGALRSTGEVGPKIVARLPDYPVTALEILHDGQGGAVVVAHPPVDRLGQGYGGKPFELQGGEDQPRQTGNAALSGTPGSLSWTGGQRRGAVGDVGGMTAARYAALKVSEPKMQAWNETNRRYWGGR
jgi:hypothetical protein